jgi:hypothetical protein
MGQPWPVEADGPFMIERTAAAGGASEREAEHRLAGVQAEVAAPGAGEDEGGGRVRAD